MWCEATSFPVLSLWISSIGLGKNETLQKLAGQAGILGAASRAEMADVEQMKNIILSSRVKLPLVKMSAS